MLIIINILSTALIIYFSKSIIILSLVALISIANIIIYEVGFLNLIKRLKSVFIINIFIFIAYCLSYGHGEVLHIFKIKIYIEGIYSGADLLIRILLLSFYIFSLNISTRKESILADVHRIFKRISFLNRVFAIILNSVYLTEVFFQKINAKQKKYSLFKAATIIKEILLEIDEHKSPSRHSTLEKLKNVDVFEKIVFILTLALFILSLGKIKLY